MHWCHECFGFLIPVEHRLVGALLKISAVNYFCEKAQSEADLGLLQYPRLSAFW